ncbi:hypothetical protein EB796_019254 [Bugula neritina]|uniref:MDN2-binding protein C-terminal domain-containing protein n=1 Tax=Bugula neritina TaxID=10212 RepID=A0A7J7J8T1_BUGNE|nr:hypothetical protein EB796_019254 [Bugula neritina]
MEKNYHSSAPQLAYVVVGSSKTTFNDKLAGISKIFSEDKVLLYCYDIDSNENDWTKYDCSTEELPHFTICDADQLHVALDSFNSHFQQKLINVTLLWYFQPVDCENEELQGAILRSFLCDNSRVVVVLEDSSHTSLLEECWVQGYVPLAVVSDVLDISHPLWRGDLVVQTQGESDRIFVEISNLENTKDLTAVASHINIEAASVTGSYLETVCQVNLSSLHRCMLSNCYKLKVISNNQFHLPFCKQDCGYIVRMVKALHHPSSGSGGLGQSSSPSTILTTQSWMSFFLKGNLSKPSKLPAGPVSYKYYLLSQEHDYYFCWEFDTRDLTHCLLSQRESSGIQESQTDKNFSCDENFIASVKLEPGLEGYKDIITSYLFSDKICSMLDRPQGWLERIALQEFIERRKIVEKANSFGMKSKNSDSQSSKCMLTLNDVRNHFDCDGQAKDPKFRLPVCNKENTDLREYTWPKARLHFGPGICYADDEATSKLADPRTIMYRDKYNFPETASLYTTEVMPSANSSQQKSKAAVYKQSKNSTGCRSPRRNKTITHRRHIKEHQLKKLSTGHTDCSSESKHPPCNSKSVMDSREPVKTEPDSRYTGILESTSNTKAIQKDSAYTTKQQRAERNKKNEQRMRSAIQKALSKNGIKRNHKSYEAYTEELFLLCMRCVKKLKTSVDLEKKMKEIAIAYAPAAIFTINQSVAS